MKYDLHCHTTCSDGSLTPAELIQKGVEAGLQGLSITDHDTIQAYESFKPGPSLIAGVEFSSSHLDETVHILGYSFSLDSPLIHALCQRHKERRENRNDAILELLGKIGMPIDPHELKRPGPDGKTPSIGRPHIANQMVKLGYVSSLKEAFHKYLGDSKPCFVPGERFTVAETLDVIHGAGGVAIIAHPHLLKRNKVIKALLAMDFDGIEAHYASFGGHDAKKWEDFAKERDWLVTGGSDFHGDPKPNNFLGSSYAPAETIEYLLSLQK